MMTSIQPFQYTPLTQPDSIRLLRFSKTIPPSISPIIELFQICLCSTPVPIYKALSYTWGEASNLVAVQITAGSSTKASQINVTPNCAAALQRLYENDPEVPIWIDAICIDQSNLEERAQQVSIMRDVYKLASQTIIFLGTQDKDSDIAMNYFSQFRDSKAVRLARLQEVDLQSPVPGAIQRFFSRPWFERVWVLQEANWGRDAIVLLSGSGETQISWISIKTASQDPILQRRFGLDHSVKTPAILGFISSLTMVHHVDSPGNLLQRLHETRGLKATDSRDKVFALLSTGFEAKCVPTGARTGVRFLRRNQDEGQIQTAKSDVEITYSHPCAKVYTSLAKDLITRDRNLDVLSGVQSPSTMEGLPSWVPDWSISPRRSILAAAFATSRYNADGTQPVQATLSTAISAPAEFYNNDNTLVVRGKRIATVTMLSDAYIPGTTPNSLLKEWELLIGEHGNHPVEENQEILALKTLVASKPPARDHGQFAKWVAAAPLWREHWYADPGNEAEFKHAAKLGTPLYNAWKLGEKVASACAGRKLFVTEQGNFGLAPQEAVIGDEIVVFMGAQVPFILRKPAEDSDSCKLIGECYTTGFMDGECMGWNDDISTCDFRLC